MLGQRGRRWRCGLMPKKRPRWRWSAAKLCVRISFGYRVRISSLPRNLDGDGVGQETVDGGYLEIHGSTEGQLAITAGDEVEERICWGDVLKEKKVAQGKVQIEVVAPSGKQWVHVRVEDADTGQPVGTRVHFRSEHGAYLAPHGHQADVNVAWFEDMGGDCKTGGVPYAYIDGTCQIDLPIGPVYAEVVRGFEYQPLRQQVEIKPGQNALTLKVKRAFDMKQRGVLFGGYPRAFSVLPVVAP